jgi:peptide/nickel transport system permease protein
LAIASALGPGTANAVIALLVVWWPVYVRLARGETITIVSQPYVVAARATGLRRIRIVLSHVIPNIVPPIIAYATADLGSVIINFSVLGFLGLGAQPPLVDLGRIVYDGDIFIQSAPWYSILPGLVIFVIVVSYALIGDMVRDYLDPKSRI